MAQLSLDFSVLFDYTTNQLVFTDNTSYPVGVAEGVTGIFYVKQPDNNVQQGVWTNPDVKWIATPTPGLTKAKKSLRLDIHKRPMKGKYIFKYTVRHADYDESTFTKVIDFDYERPEMNVGIDADVFTPSLFADDFTDYTSTAWVIDIMTRDWNVTVGNLGNLVSTEKRWPLLYASNYYDAKYVFALVVNVSFLTTDPALTWVTIKDRYKAGNIVNIFTPLPYDELLGALRVIADRESGCAHLPGECHCDDNGGLARAQVLFDYIKSSICGFDTIGLYAALEEFMNIYGEFEEQVNTNTIIQPYDRSFCSTENGNPDDENSGLPDDIEFVVGRDAGYPVDGDVSYTNPAFIGWNIRMFIAAMIQGKVDPSTGVYYTKPKESDTITLINQTFVDGSFVQIQFASGLKGNNVDGGVNQVQADWAVNNAASPAFVKNKPTAFTPAPHMHPMTDITGLLTILDTKSDEGHHHVIVDVDGLQAALDAKMDDGEEIPISQVTNLQSILDSIGGGIFTDVVVVPSSQDMLANDVGKVHQFRAGAVAAVLTLPPLSSVPVRTVTPIETLAANSVQNQIKAQPGEFIFFANYIQNDIWMGVGETLWLYKDTAGWFVLNNSFDFADLGSPILKWAVADPDYSFLKLEGQVLNRADYPRLWWFAQSLGASIVTDAQWLTTSVVYLGTTVTKPYRGCFSRGDNSSTFRLPDMRGMYARGIANFGGADVLRPFNFPGIYAPDTLRSHHHTSFISQEVQTGNLPGAAGKRLSPSNSPVDIYQKTSGEGKESASMWGETTEPTVGKTSQVGGIQNSVQDIGFFWCIKY